MSNSPMGAASATYRKAVNKIANVLDKDPNHSRYPSLDFDEALADIPDAMKEKAVEWYVRGIKRGMAKATDLMAKGDIYIEKDTVIAPDNISVNVRIKFKGGDWESLQVMVKSKEIGFK
ncbi:MAG: hypothetical protein Q9M10_05185 [Mariprofundaceae bacterium]|nr:hypothetical protein [Mariprofundaceae bacterium]